jgi:hypothetical protein
MSGVPQVTDNETVSFTFKWRGPTDKEPVEQIVEYYPPTPSHLERAIIEAAEKKMSIHDDAVLMMLVMMQCVKTVAGTPMTKAIWTKMPLEYYYTMAGAFTKNMAARVSYIKN